MSIKIEGGDGTAENVIKAGTSNELLYNDKEVLLKENFVGLDLDLLPPDLEKTDEWIVVRAQRLYEERYEVSYNKIIVPEDGWIIKVDLYRWNNLYNYEITDSYFINIDGIGALEMTPGQYYIGNDFLKDSMRDERLFVAIRNLNCPYPVKKGQEILWTKNLSNMTRKYMVIVTFAPCMSV